MKGTVYEGSSAPKALRRRGSAMGLIGVRHENIPALHASDWFVSALVLGRVIVLSVVEQVG
eukprot:6086818-Pyramimonas_sp.AAC.2